MSRIRIGAPHFLAIRPLIFGLLRHYKDDVELVYDAPGALSYALECGDVDAALIPSIEYLRGVGQHFVSGPAQIATGRTRSLVLVSKRPLDMLARIAVSEEMRTPLAALRIVLDRAHHATPDFCVYQGDPNAWSDSFDAALITGDRGLETMTQRRDPRLQVHDVGEMWRATFQLPLVVSLWAYNDEKLASRLQKMLTESRDYGVSALPDLCAGVAESTAYHTEFLQKYLSTGWAYHLGRDEEVALRTLESEALSYQLIRSRRLAPVLTG